MLQAQKAHLAHYINPKLNFPTPPYPQLLTPPCHHLHRRLGAGDGVSGQVQATVSAAAASAATCGRRRRQSRTAIRGWRQRRRPRTRGGQVIARGHATSHGSAPLPRGEWDHVVPHMPWSTLLPPLPLPSVCARPRGGGQKQAATFQRVQVGCDSLRTRGDHGGPRGGSEQK